MFSLEATTPHGRRGTLATAHGILRTPFFMPCATAGAMKGITLPDLHTLGCEILLCNTYHLHLFPGELIVREAGGLHRFIGWEKPILTDSGGFQVFSLQNIRSISEGGVSFRDHRSGAEHFIGPREAIKIQHQLGADIILCLDECPASTAPRINQMKAVDRTIRWARECKEEHKGLKIEKSKTSKKTKRNDDTLTSSLSSLSSLSSSSSYSSPLLFAVIQGGLERDLRQKCAEELTSIGFDGYALGGLAVGETEEEMFGVLDFLCPLLPRDKPRYLLGVGERSQLRECAKKGIDMFDCVAPMREARHGNVWLSDGSKLRIRQSEFQHDHAPVDPDSPSPLSKKHLRSYLHHLMRIGERYGETIAVLQNVAVTLEAIRQIRSSIDVSSTSV